MRDFNFFKPYLGEEKESQNTKKFKYGLLLLLALFILATLGWNTISVMNLNKDIDKLQVKLEDPERIERYKEAEVVIAKQNLLKEYEEKFQGIYTSIYKKDVINTRFIVQLSSTIPQKVYFQNINASNESLSISGVSSDRVSIAEFLYNISQCSFVEEASISNITENAEGEYSFNISCVLKEGEINEDQ
ncbi:PilN domain-containing protein [Alloiococcus sp. CFN-8]|uniref:PilN domain-containing protein n=1 Tax=Alloiococcus sp. CFN-8 TaxID=3416081 RepID=UPI003CF431B6